MENDDKAGHDIQHLTNVPKSRAGIKLSSVNWSPIICSSSTEPKTELDDRKKFNF